VTNQTVSRCKLLFGAQVGEDPVVTVGECKRVSVIRFKIASAVLQLSVTIIRSVTYSLLYSELTSIATDSPRQLALLLKMAFKTLSNRQDLLSLNLSRWPKDDSYSQGKVRDNIMFEGVDSVQKHHSSVKILIVIFSLIVSIIYRSND